MPKLPIETLKGPGGVKLVLDPNEIIPSNPGEGTPAMVYSRSGKAATYECAVETGELDCGEAHLTDAQVHWLQDQEAAVEAMYAKYPNGAA